LGDAHGSDWHTKKYDGKTGEGWDKDGWKSAWSSEGWRAGDDLPKWSSYPTQSDKKDAHPKKVIDYEASDYDDSQFEAEEVASWWGLSLTCFARSCVHSLVRSLNDLSFFRDLRDLSAISTIFG
jgi:hypothetical protein